MHLRLHKITSLTLDDVCEPPKDEISNLTALKWLEISCHELSEENDALLVPLPSSLSTLSNLEHLALSSHRYTYDSQHIPQTLTSLETSSCIQPSMLLRLTCLQQLSLSYMSYQTVQETLQIASHQLPSLRSLSLAKLKSSEFTDGISTLHKLQELRVCSCDNMREVLPSSETWCSQLTALTQLTISGCVSFAMLPKSAMCLTALRRLEVTGCSHADRRQLMRLRAALDGLQVVWVPHWDHE